MTDFNQNDDQITPPVVPPHDNNRRKRLSSDELIALFLAFTGLGGILFWSLSQKTSPINLGSLTSGAPSFSNGNSASTIPTPSSDGVPFSGTSQVKANATTEAGLTDPNNQSDRHKWSIPPQSGTDAQPKPEPAAAVAAGGLAAGAIANSANPTESAKPLPSPTSSVKGTIEAPVQAKQFSDVPSDFWAKDAIAALSSRGVINGFSDNTFKPNQPINRAEFAGIVQKAFDKPKTKEIKKFTDIKEGFWAATAIDEATQTGFMNGYPGGLFKPEQAIPRLEMLSAIATGMTLAPKGDPTQTLARYSDAKDLPNWAVPKVSSAIEAGISIPNSTLLEPTKTATRADAAAFIYQALIKEGKIKP